MTTLTWKCEVCGRDRPDEDVGVAKHELSEYVTRNVNYCLDNQLCVRAAHDPLRWQISARSGNEAEITVRPNPTRVIREWETCGFSRWHPIRRWRARRAWRDRPEGYEIHTTADERPTR